MKKRLLMIILIFLLTMSCIWFYQSYSDVVRFQKRAINNINKKIALAPTGEISSEKKYRIKEDNRSEKYVTRESRVIIPEREHLKMEKVETHKPQLVSEEIPGWVQQSPMIIAIGIWLEMAKNLVTLLMSMLTALFMYWAYKKEKAIEVEIMEDRE
jgi:hypothetical protein